MLLAEPLPVLLREGLMEMAADVRDEALTDDPLALVMSLSLKAQPIRWVVGEKEGQRILIEEFGGGAATHAVELLNVQPQPFLGLVIDVQEGGVEPHKHETDPILLQDVGELPWEQTFP